MLRTLIEQLRQRGQKGQQREAGSAREGVSTQARLQPVAAKPELAPAAGGAAAARTEPPRLSGAATLWHLERLVSEQGRSDPRGDERHALLYALRSVARPDGTIPEEFWSLLEETFGELLA